jgi:hypothetical protein
MGVCGRHFRITLSYFSQPGLKVRQGVSSIPEVLRVTQEEAQ